MLALLRSAAFDAGPAPAWVVPAAVAAMLYGAAMSWYFPRLIERPVTSGQLLVALWGFAVSPWAATYVAESLGTSRWLTAAGATVSVGLLASVTRRVGGG